MLEPRGEPGHSKVQRAPKYTRKTKATNEAIVSSNFVPPPPFERSMHQTYQRSPSKIKGVPLAAHRPPREEDELGGHISIPSSITIHSSGEYFAKRSDETRDAPHEQRGLHQYLQSGQKCSAAVSQISRVTTIVRSDSAAIKPSQVGMYTDPRPKIKTQMLLRIPRVTPKI